jgi:phosphate transport system substrate-binding protein
MLRAGRLLLRISTFAAPGAALALGGLVLAAGAAAGQPLRVTGSTTVNAVVVEAAEILRAERKTVIQVDTQGGSSGGIAALGEGRADLAMSSRPLLDEDRARFPKVRLQPVKIGVDAVALVVSKDVWDGGVRALSREQVRRLYEGEVKNWREVGGPDRRVVFFNKEPGRGTWEVFAHWLYGGADKAPLVSHPEVGANEEARNKVASSRGAITQLSAAWADGRTTFALGIRTPDGKVVAPTPAALAGGLYPLSRPLLVISNGPPQGIAKALLDLLLAPRGQALVRKHGYLALDQLHQPPARR